MKQTTKRVLTLTAVSALIIGAAGGVFARGGFGPGWGGHHGMMGGGPGYGGGPGMMGGGRGMFQAQNLDQIKTNLGITPEQEPAWNAYADAVQARTDLMNSHRQAMFSGTVTPDQRLAFHQEGLAQMQKVVEARQALYATLTPEQQARGGYLTGRNCRRW